MFITQGQFFCFYTQTYLQIMVIYLTPTQGRVAIKIDKPSYFPGETIRGVIYIRINKADIGAGTLFVKLIGLEKANQLDGFNQFYSLKSCFYKKKRKVSFFGNVLPKMAVKKYFELEVPDKHPSFTINYYKQVQCRIVYFLSVQFSNADNSVVIKPRKSHRICVHINQPLPPTVIKPLQISAQDSNIKKCCFSKGTCKLVVVIQKTCFLIGEDIDLQIMVNNSDCGLRVEKIIISVQAQLQVAYRQAKRNLYSYFGLNELELNDQVEPYSQKALTAKLPLKQGQPDYIFPQSTVKTHKLSFKYNMCVQAILEKSFNRSSNNICRLTVPLSIYQHNLRELKPEVNFQEEPMSHLSQIQSVTSLNRDAHNRSNRSKARNFPYSDHHTYGFGPQDGYTGPPREFDPYDSMDSDELRDEPGAFERLQLKRKVFDEEKEEEFIEQFEGKSEVMNSQQSFEDSNRNPGEKNTIFSRPNNLQSIKEEANESKFRDSMQKGTYRQDQSKDEVVDMQQIELQKVTELMPEKRYSSQEDSQVPQSKTIFNALGSQRGSLLSQDQLISRNVKQFETEQQI